MTVFALATLLPVALLLMGLWAGGVWLWAAVLYTGGLVVLLDQLLPSLGGTAREDAEFPGADALLVAVALSVLGLMPLTVLGVVSGSLSLGEKLLLVLATGAFLGQVGHPAAHELIHRPGRGLYRLGVLTYGVLLLGHHASAHRLVHHVAVATPDDPYTARAGEGFWRFAARASVGGFRAGKAAEDIRRARAPGREGVHPYAWYLGIGAASLALAVLIGGGLGLLVWLGLAAHAQMQQLLGDYVQHYGLLRARLPDGRFEPVGTRHAWNAPHWLSSALMLNAPRHSDHHTHPGRAYPALRLAPEAPLLPWPLPLACTLALVPRLWHRRMRPHLQRWHEPAGQDPAQ